MLEKNLEKQNNSELVDAALRESIERIRNELKKLQEDSENKYFKKMNVDEMNPETLMILKETIDKEGTPFSEEIIKDVQETEKESLLSDYEESGDLSFKDKEDYEKDLISRYPNAFYKKREEE